VRKEANGGRPVVFLPHQDYSTYLVGGVIQQFVLEATENCLLRLALEEVGL